jgi:ankyrin repeat protein
LKAWPQGTNVADADGKCALHYAAEHGSDPTVVAALIEQNALAVMHACDDDGSLPLHLAVM